MLGGRRTEMDNEVDIPSESVLDGASAKRTLSCDGHLGLGHGESVGSDSRQPTNLQFLSVIIHDGKIFYPPNRSTPRLRSRARCRRSSSWLPVTVRNLVTRESLGGPGPLQVSIDDEGLGRARKDPTAPYTWRRDILLPVVFRRANLLCSRTSPHTPDRANRKLR